MALIALTSAQGSPGVSTTALGLAISWPRPVVLLDADPTGASALWAGYFRGAHITNPATVLDLALAARDGQLAQALEHATFPIPDTDVAYLPGVRSHTQAPGLAPLWAPLARCLKALEASGRDAIIDIGRLGLLGSPSELLAAADLTMVLTRTTLPAVVGARSWVGALNQQASATGTRPPQLVLVGPGQPYGAREITDALGAPVLATLAWDPASAETFSLGAAPARRIHSAALIKSLRALATTSATTLAELTPRADAALLTQER